jgi:hypothetical protein
LPDDGAGEYWFKSSWLFTSYLENFSSEGYALIYDPVRDTPASILKAAGREFGRFRLSLLWLHAFEEPFYSREDLESLARASQFKDGQTRFVGVLCSLILQKTIA